MSQTLRLPRLYKGAGRILKEVKEENGSLKQLIYSTKYKFYNIKAIYSLVATALQQADVLDLLLRKTNLLEKVPRLDPWLARILVTELLWGKGSLPSYGAKLPALADMKPALQEELRRGGEPTRRPDDAGMKRPRYVRVNMLLTTVAEVICAFRDEGWTLRTKRPRSYAEFLQNVAQLQGDEFFPDYHIPELLVFPVGTEFHQYELYIQGHIMLQDKASLLPVVLLNPPPGSVTLDMCAAPGLKTTHIAAVQADQGKVYAVELKEDRYKTLCKMVEQSGATCITPILKNAFELQSKDCQDVEFIMVDPSCSGSGIVDRVGYEQHSESRIRSLVSFQTGMLRHALSGFPKARRVVYSTCSLNREENEGVLAKVLETPCGFRVVQAELKGSWDNWGTDGFEMCLYSRPEHDLTNGFFVAVLERTEEAMLQHGMEAELTKGEAPQSNKLTKGKAKKEEQEMTKGNGINGGVERSKKSEKKKGKKVESGTEREEEQEIIEGNAVSGGVGGGRSKKNKRKKGEIIEGSEATADVEELESEITADVGGGKSKKNKRKKGEIIEESGTTADVEELESEITVDVGEGKSKKNKRKKGEIIEESEATADVEELESEITADVGGGRSKKNKRKKEKIIEESETTADVEELESEITTDVGGGKSKKNKRKRENAINGDVERAKKSKKEKEKIIEGSEATADVEELESETTADVGGGKSKKNKRKKGEIIEESGTTADVEELESEITADVGGGKSKKNKRKKGDIIEESEATADVEELESEITADVGGGKSKKNKRKRENAINGDVERAKKSKKEKEKIIEESEATADVEELESETTADEGEGSKKKNKKEKEKTIKETETATDVKEKRLRRSKRSREEGKLN